MFALPRYIQHSAIALLLCTTALAALPAHAVVNNAAPVPEATAHKTHRHHGRSHMNHEFSMRERVEARIKDLHDSIGVTSEQESDWNDVAQAMRDSESNIGELIKARHNSSENTNAIDDIKSYQAISQAHADSMSKFVDAFEPFYNDLSQEQKQKADAYFRNFQHQGRMHAHEKRSMRPMPTKTSGTMPNDAIKVK